MIAAAALLAGCGQRGALYLPDEDRNVVVTSAPTTSAAPAGPPTAPAADSVPQASPALPTSPATDPEEQRRNSTAPAQTPAQ